MNRRRDSDADADVGGFVDGIGFGHGGSADAAAGAEGSMGGMDMGQGTSQPKSTVWGMTMGHGGDMSHCMGMMGMAMDHGKDMAPLPAGPMRIQFGGKSAEWTVAALAALPHKR